MPLWTNRYNGPGNSYDFPTSLGVSPTGTSIFVGGYSKDEASRYDYATIAYSVS